MLEKYRKDSLLQERIDDVLTQMKGWGAEDEEYGKMIDQLEKLHKMKAAESPKPVSYDTVVLSASNLIGILAIVKYEQTAVIISKAMNFMHKLR